MMGNAVVQRGVRRRLMLSRLVCTLAVLVVAAAFATAVAVFAMLKQIDTERDLQHRQSLMTALQELRQPDGAQPEFTPAVIERLERASGARGLSFSADASPTPEREMHSIVDPQGRIIGWLSWSPHPSLQQRLAGLLPLLVLTGMAVFGFALFAFWHIRRAMRDLVQSESRAWSLAHEDMLTRLPNQRRLVQQLAAAIEARAPADIVAVALLDIDGLNEVNQIHGQAAGDALLVAWGERLRDHLGPDGFCARFDSDQFAVLGSGPDAQAVARDIRALQEALERPFWIADRAVQVGCTAGLAHAPAHGQTAEELLRRADLALRAAKRKSRGGLALFEPVMDIEVTERRFIERELKRALADRVLDVHYQPIVAADGARILGVEALLRWTHPERGAISPSVFVPVAEQSGLMIALGEFVLRQALQDAVMWPEIFIAVNLSPVQVRDPALVELVASVMATREIDPGRVVLEVTEGVLIENPDEAAARLDALRALGVRLALDDFGTGYSSLTYLQRFRFDKLKIDKGFVDPLGTSPDAQAIMLGIVNLGRALGLTVLAEGVETEEQRVLLRLAGCEEMQGYLFARPGPKAAMDQLMIDHRAQTRTLLRTG